MEINEFIKKEKINAFCNFIIDPYSYEEIVYVRKEYDSQTAKDYILSKTNCNELRLISSLRFVNLSLDKLLQDINTLSMSEKLKVELAINLILNKEQIILYQFDKHFMEKELFFFKKLFKKLVSKYKKSIVLIDCDFSFMLDFVDRYILLTKKNEIKVFSKDDIYNSGLEKYIDIPPIIDFVKYVNKDIKRLYPYTELKELIKEIYREV